MTQYLRLRLIPDFTIAALKYAELISVGYPTNFLRIATPTAQIPLYLVVASNPGLHLV